MQPNWDRGRQIQIGARNQDQGPGNTNTPFTSVNKRDLCSFYILFHLYVSV